MSRPLTACGVTLAFHLMTLPAAGQPAVQRTAAQQPLSTLEHADLLLSEAQALFDQAAGSDVSARATVRLLQDAQTTVQTVVDLTWQVMPLTAEDVATARELRARARAIADGVRLVDDTIFATRVRTDLENLHARIEAIRPECGVPDFSVDWGSHFDAITHSLKRLHRGDVEPVSARTAVDALVEALYTSLRSHESHSVKLCTLFDEYQEVLLAKQRTILHGSRLSDVVRSVELQQRHARSLPLRQECSNPGYLRVVNAPSSFDGLATKNYRAWPRHAAAFVRDHLRVDSVNGLTLEPPVATTLETGPTTTSHGCGRPIRVTKVLERVPGAVYAVALQEVSDGLRTTRDDRPSHLSLLYLEGIRDEIVRLAAADAADERAAYVAEYERRFGRIDSLAKRLADDIQVARLNAGDIEGDDREKFWSLLGQHIQDRAARERLIITTTSDQRIARETAASNLEAAKATARAHVQAAKIQAEGMVRAAKERARSSRLGSLVGGLANIVGKFIPTSMFQTVVSESTSEVHQTYEMRR